MRTSGSLERSSRGSVRFSLTNPNLAEYAALCGAQGEAVRTPAELEPAMARMLAATGPFLLHIVQDGELV